MFLSINLGINIVYFATVIMKFRFLGLKKLLLVYKLLFVWNNERHREINNQRLANELFFSWFGNLFLSVCLFLSYWDLCRSSSYYKMINCGFKYVFVFGKPLAAVGNHFSRLLINNWYMIWIIIPIVTRSSNAKEVLQNFFHFKSNIGFFLSLSNFITDKFQLLHLRGEESYQFLINFP